MDNSEILKCTYCKYTTNRNYNLNRHLVNKHSKEIINNENKLNINQNVHLNSQEVHQNSQEVHRNSQEVHQNSQEVHLELNNEIYDKNKMICKKCNKEYLKKINLINHESKCKGVDILTCSRCMKSFSSKQAKCNHIKRNTCKPRSIIHARTPNIKNINNTTNNNNIDNSITNNTNNTNNNTTNNIININNYGSERLDYINYDKYLSIFKKNYDIPSALTEEIHFNHNFPENNNIIYNDKTSVLIKSNDNYLEKDTRLLVEELINNKSRIIQSFAHKNKSNICENISCTLYDEIIELLLKLIVKEPLTQYNKQIKKITDLIRNNKVL